MNLHDSKFQKQPKVEQGYDDGFYEERIERSSSELSAFIKQTYQLFAASLVAGAAGAYVGVGISHIISGSIFIISIAWIIGGVWGLNAVKHKAGINVIALFLFTFVGGIILGPLLTHVIGMNGGAGLVAKAFISSSVLFGGLSLYAMNSKADFSSWGKPLMIALLITIGISLVNMFIFQSPIMHVVILGVMLMIFSALVLYDTQAIIRGEVETPIDGAIMLYLDFLNIFMIILQFFGIAGGDD